MNSCSPTFTTSGGKYVGAAVLPRTSCHKGMFRLLSFRSGALYFAAGLFVTGQGGTVVGLRKTTIKKVRRYSLPGDDNQSPVFFFIYFCGWRAHFFFLNLSLL